MTDTPRYHPGFGNHVSTEAVPGALPPLIGWSAGAQSQGFEVLRDHGGLALFALMFIWQIPHFLAIAWMYQDDYAKGGYIVLPLIDPDIRILACARPMLEAIGVAVGAVSVSAADITADKWRTHQFFETLDLPTPPSWLPAQILETDPQYPLFIKPRGGSAGKDGFRVENRRELEFFLDYVPNPMVQKCIEGPEITTDVLCDLDGTLLGVVSRRRIEVRSGEVAKGVTVRCQPVIDACVRIARDLPAVGPITVQCLMQGDTPCFTEINARLGGGIPLGIAAGFDVPLLLLGRCAGMPVGPPPLGSYETGLHITRFDDSFFLEEQRRVQIAGQHIELHRNSAV